MSADPTPFSSYLNLLDWLLFALIGVITVAVALLGHSKRNTIAHQKESKSSDQLSLVETILMGRRLTLPLFVATLVATWYGGILGVTQLAFQSGVYNFVTQGAFWYLTYLIFAFFLVQKVRQTQALTLPHLVLKLVGPRSAKLAAYFNLLNIVPVAYVMSLGIFMQGMFGGDYFLSTLLATSCVVTYSLVGGFRGVVFSDLVQFGVMVFSVVTVACLSWHQFGGLDYLQERLPATHFQITGTYTWSQTLIWGLLALSTLVDPNFYQRCLAAKSSQVAKKGILTSTLIWVIFDLSTTAGAMYAYAYNPQAKAATAYLIYALELLPHGLRGVLLAGILATILSTLDSYIFLGGSTLTHDLFPDNWPLKKHHHKFGILLIAGGAMVLAHFFAQDIPQVWKTLGSYSAACLLLPMMWMFFSGPNSRPKDQHFFWSSLSGALAITLCKLLPPSLFGHPLPQIQIEELYIGLLVTFFGLAFSLLLTKWRS